MDISPQAFGASFKGFLDQMSTAAPAEEPIFRRRLRDHFDCEPTELAILSEKFPPYDHANLQQAIDAEFESAGGSVATFGVINAHPYMGTSLSELAAASRGGLMGGGGAAEGPVEYANIKLDDDRVVACVQSGLFLVKWGGEPLAILMSGPAREFHPMPQITIQVMAPSRDTAEKFLAGLRFAMRKRNVYRGHVISLAETRLGGTEIKFHKLPGVLRRGHHLAKGPAGTDRAHRPFDSRSFLTSSSSKAGI